MYEDMYKDYSDQEFDYSYPYSFRLENKKYLETYPQINAWWYYGDTVSLNLTISDNVEDISSFTGKTIIVSLYNFRKEVISSKEFSKEDIEISDAKLIINYQIDYEESTDIFTRGIYYCGIDVVVKDEEEINSCETILNRDNYLIRVI